MLASVAFLLFNLYVYILLHQRRRLHEGEVHALAAEVCASASVRTARDQNFSAASRRRVSSKWRALLCSPPLARDPEPVHPRERESEAREY